MHIDRRTIKTVLITVIITTLIVIIILVLAAWRGVHIVIDNTINGIVKTVQDQCLTDTLDYRGKIFIPSHPDRFDRKLSGILWDVAGAVSSANCKDVPVPPPFNRREIFFGPDGDGIAMFGQAFWSENQRTHRNFCCLAFSGTYSTSQWNNNLNLDLVPADMIPNAHDDAAIHGGFAKIYEAIRPSIWKWLDEHKSRFRWIIVTGRSLGGAISTLCAYDLAKELRRRGIGLIHYTFASPRVGNPIFAQHFNKLVPNSMRVFNTEDIVVDLPPPVWRSNVYQHVGRSCNARPFTSNGGNMVDNHIEAYRNPPI